MADRVGFYFRQRVTEAELDLAFALLEKADRDLAADLNIYGIVSGAVPAPHSPVPDLTVDLTAPARAYDNLATPTSVRTRAERRSGCSTGPLRPRATYVQHGWRKPLTIRKDVLKKRRRRESNLPPRSAAHTSRA
jgi:hypothetical protein